MAEWKAVYNQNGGYDCITSAYFIEKDGKAVAEVDRCLFDNVSEWDDEGEKNVGMVEVAEFIVKACNDHEKMRAGLVAALEFMSLVESDEWANGGPETLPAVDDLRELLA